MNDEWHAGWKVVAVPTAARHARASRAGGRSPTAPRDGRVYYLASHVATPRPRCGALTVFRRRDDAQRFAAAQRPSACTELRIMPCAWLPTTEWVRELYTPACAYTLPAGYTPSGTAFARAVMVFGRAEAVDP